MEIHEKIVFLNFPITTLSLLIYYVCDEKVKNCNLLYIQINDRM